MLAGAAAALGWFALWLARRYRRYEVAGASMLPALRPGDWVVVDRAARARAGEIVLAGDPRDGERTMVKRVARRQPGGALWLLGDNRAASTDSRALGAFQPDLLLGRVRWRYWPPPLGAVR